MDAANDQIQSILAEIDQVFEPAPELHILLTSDEEKLLAESEDGHVTQDMITYIGTLLRRMKGRRELDAILNAHPRLGAQKVDSAQSRSEQASLTSSSEETEQLRKLNEEYEAAFPGLRYVVFVNGRPRSVIMQNMRERIQRASMDKERDEAIDAMVDIARDRLRKEQL